MLSDWLCRLGFHRWRHHHGDVHHYQECGRCGARRVLEAVNGHQPIDGKWLAFREHRPGPHPSPPLCGWHGVVNRRPCISPVEDRGGRCGGSPGLQQPAVD